MLCVVACWLLYDERCRITWAIVCGCYALLMVGCCWLLSALCAVCSLALLRVCRCCCSVLLFVCDRLLRWLACLFLVCCCIDVLVEVVWCWLLVLLLRGAVMCCSWVFGVCRILVLVVDVGCWCCSLLIDGRCSLLFVVCLLLLRVGCCLSCSVTCVCLLLVAL